MLLTGIPANSIHSLRELSHAYYAFQWQWISFWLEMEPPDAERVAVGSRDHSLVSSLKKSVSRRNLTTQSPATLSYLAVTNAPPTTVNLSVFISLYLSLSGLQQQMQKRLNFLISSTQCMVRPNYAGVL